ncbi:MAG: serine hydrolase [Rhodocyclaceae bacterium]|nr:serine hydrolase [Rhodocyclaceae bacterium]
MTASAHALNEARLIGRRRLAGLLAAWPLASLAQDAAPTVAASADRAFEGMDAHIERDLPNVQSAVVMWRGQSVYAYHRDGNPDTLHDVQSIDKSAASTLVGIAMAEKRFAGLDQPIEELMPEWAGLNADARTRSITLRHLLSMSTGFDTRAPWRRASTASAWSRPLAQAPGSAFAYDNALAPLVGALLEKHTGRPVARYAQDVLTGPLGMAAPSLDGGTLRMRTRDMATLGQLWLQRGRWAGVQRVDPDYLDAATAPQNSGGRPGGLPYGLGWWIPPAEPSRRTFFALGFGGQYIWVHPPRELVIATTSTVAGEAAPGGAALDLIRGRLFAAVGRLAAAR